jgi:diguanylate cyclase (GGDEF)-like protein
MKKGAGKDTLASVESEPTVADARTRVGRPGDDGAVALALSASLLRYRQTRMIVFAILALLNCAAIAVITAPNHALSLLTTAFEVVMAVGLVALLGIDDTLLYISKVDKLVYHWKLIATRDSLTGLYNRLAFLQTLDKRISLTTAKSARYGVMFIDLNKFKPINDQFGHEVGDNVLRIAARRLRSVAGNDDMVARLGGDEFAILMSRTNVMLARKLEFAIEQVFKTPITINGAELVLSCSIGTCLESDHHRTAEDVLRAADSLMYRQKALERWKGNTRMNAMRVQKIKGGGASAAIKGKR